MNVEQRELPVQPIREGPPTHMLSAVVNVDLRADIRPAPDGEFRLGENRIAFAEPPVAAKELIIEELKLIAVALAGGCTALIPS